jgi:CBS domain containing-hemolysin-like protein
MNLDIAVLIVAALLFVIFSGFLSCIDTAIMVADDIRMAVLLESAGLKERTRKRLKKSGAKRDKHMAAMMVFSTLSSVLSNAMLGAMAYGKMAGPYVVVFMVALTYCSLVFSRTLPKIVARIHYDKILLRFDWLARLIYILMTPMVFLTLMWVELFKLSSKRQMNLSELKSTINFYRQEGVIESTEESMLQNVFMIKQFTLKDVIQVSQMPFVDKDCEVEQCKELAQSYFGKNLLVRSGESIVGVMYYHDLAARIISEKGGRVEELYRPVILCKSDDNLMDVLAKMKESKTPLVVVLGDDGHPQDVVSAKRIYAYILSSKQELPAPRMIGY